MSKILTLILRKNINFLIIDYYMNVNLNNYPISTVSVIIFALKIIF